MINLLPPQTKKDLKTAKQNVIIRNYLIATILIGILILLTFGVSFRLVRNQVAAARDSQSRSNESIKELEDTKKAGSEFISNVTLAKQILNSDLSFYNLIIDIAAVVPKGVIMSNLAVGANALTAPLAISARATNYDTAIKFKNSLDSSDIFEDVKITSLTSDEPSAEDPIAAKYRVTVSLTAKFTGVQTK